MAQHQRVIKHALFEHADQRVDPPARRIAYRGELAYLDDADLARGERHGAFLADGEPLLTPRPLGVRAVAPDGVSVIDPDRVDLDLDGVDLDTPGLPIPVSTPQPAWPPSRPAQVAPKQAWIDYAVTTGMDLSAAEALTKAELIESLGS